MAANKILILLIPGVVVLRTHERTDNVSPAPQKRYGAPLATARQNLRRAGLAGNVPP